MFEKRDLFKLEGKDLIQNPAKKIGLSVYGDDIRKGLNKEYRCVTETWMRENFDDSVKECFPLKNGNLFVKLEEDGGFYDYDEAKPINTMPFYFGSYILSHSKRLVHNVIKQKCVFFNINIYYTDNYSLFVHKSYSSSLVDSGFVCKSPGLGKNDNGYSGILYAWFLPPKRKSCLVIDVFGVISPKRTSNGYCEEHRMMNLNEYISLSEGKTVSGRFLIDWTKTFEGIRTLRRKHECLDYDNGKTCSNCVVKPIMKCFNCETERTCKLY